MAKETLAQLDILNAHKGHEKKSITIDDDTPEKRTQLAEHVKALLRDGFVVCLSDGKKITGYDPAENAWIIAAKGKDEMVEKVPAKGTKANALAPVTGG